MPTNCHPRADGCIVCPAIPAQPGIPGHFEGYGVAGWGAGANSVVERAGDCYTRFEVPTYSLAVAIGLKHDRDLQGVPTLIEHGLYFTAVGGVDFFGVRERGVFKTGLREREDGDQFEIRRTSGRVLYIHIPAGDDPVLIYTSLVPSGGTVIVNCCLFASGDTVL